MFHCYNLAKFNCCFDFIVVNSVQFMLVTVFIYYFCSFTFLLFCYRLFVVLKSILPLGT